MLQKDSYLVHKSFNGLKLMLFVLPSGKILEYSGPNSSESEDLQLRAALEGGELLTLLTNGYTLVVDRGFFRSGDDQSYAKTKGISYLQPHYKSKGAFTSTQVKQNRIIASYRACVEQINARLKCQRLLKSIPLTELNHIRYYLDIAVGITNRCYRPLYSPEASTSTDTVEDTTGMTRIHFPALVPPADDVKRANELDEVDEEGGMIDAVEEKKDEQNDDSALPDAQMAETKQVNPKPTSRGNSDPAKIRSALLLQGLPVPAKGEHISVKVHLKPLAAKIQVEGYEKLKALDLRKAIIVKLEQMGTVQLGPSFELLKQGIPDRESTTDTKQLRDLVFGPKQKMNLLSSEVATSNFPIVTERLLSYLFSTPTVAKRTGQAYSTTLKRAHNFTSGFSDMSSFQVRYSYRDDQQLYTITNTCEPSMSSDKRYKVAASFCSSSTWQEFKQSLRACCSCKNGEMSGNCAHIVALFIRLGQHQGSIAPRHQRITMLYLNNVFSCSFMEKCNKKKRFLARINRGS